MPPKELLFPTAMFAASIACDVFQYLVATAIWWAFFRYHEGRLTTAGQDPELDHSRLLPRMIGLFFFAKLAAVVVGYWSVGRYVALVWST